MNIRTKIFGASGRRALAAAKKPKGAKADMLDSVTVPRAETRQPQQPRRDRHRLTARQRTFIARRHEHEVELINLSGGGAMIRGELDLDAVGSASISMLGEHGEIECAVRWIRTIASASNSPTKRGSTATSDAQRDLLREVIRKSFPDVELRSNVQKKSTRLLDPSR